MENIKLLILLSGKRKCGKDFISERLQKRLGSERSEIIRISEPIKSEWAKKLNLNLKQLLSDGPYKEKYRKEMIVWSDEVRSKEYGYFCQKAIETATKSIIIVSDIRRKTDIRYFRDKFDTRMKTIRISCPDEIRISRGWKFQKGVDDVQSECDLDDYDSWDLKLVNDGSIDSEQWTDKIFSTFALEEFLI